MRSLLTIITASALLFSCGEAGVQVLVGDDYVTTFAVTGQADQSVYIDFTTSTIHDDLEEYGSIIREVDVERVIVSVENFEGSVSGNITLDLDGLIFTESDFTFDNNTTIVYEQNTADFSSLEQRIQNNNIRVSVDAASTTTLGDDDFNILVTIVALATVESDN